MSKESGSFLLQNLMYASVLRRDLIFSYSFWYYLFHIHLVLADSHTSTVAGENFPRWVISKEWRSFLLFGGGISVIACTLWGSGWTPCLDTIWPKKGALMHLKWHLHLFNLRVSKWPPIFVNCLHVLPWSLQSVSYPTIKTTSVILKTLGSSLKILSIFHWNASPTGAAPNNNILYPYLQNLKENVDKI